MVTRAHDSIVPGSFRNKLDIWNRMELEKKSALHILQLLMYLLEESDANEESEEMASQPMAVSIKEQGIPRTYHAGSGKPS